MFILFIRLMYWLSFYYISSAVSVVICSLVSPSYDPHLAIWWLMHDVVMIAGFNIVLICHDPIMACHAVS